MRSERGTAEQTAPARGREQSEEEEKGAGMTDYSSSPSVVDRLPRWIYISPKPGKMGTDEGNGQQQLPLLIFFISFIFFMLELTAVCLRNGNGKLVRFTPKDKNCWDDENLFLFKMEEKIGPYKFV